MHRLLGVSLSLVFLFSSWAHANHGPGASGGGSATISGETLKPGHFELSLREDFTKFEHFSESAAIQRARENGDFDALDHGFITTASLSVGVFENFEIDVGIGYFVGNEFVGADSEDGTDVEFSRSNPQGFTDAVILGKYRFMSGRPGNIALVGGVVLPTGTTDERLGNGEALSPTDQPGTGRFGLPVGIGYSRFLTSQLTIDASALYTFRFERDHFDVGDRLDLGVALAYRLTESIKQFPQFSVFTELNDVYLRKDEVDNESDDNSGGNSLYVTPGFRVRFDSHTALTVAPSIPVWQDLNGDQGRVEFKVAVTFALSF